MNRFVGGAWRGHFTVCESTPRSVFMIRMYRVHHHRLIKAGWAERVACGLCGAASGAAQSSMDPLSGRECVPLGESSGWAALTGLVGDVSSSRESGEGSFTSWTDTQRDGVTVCGG